MDDDRRPPEGMDPPPDEAQPAPPPELPPPIDSQSSLARVAPAARAVDRPEPAPAPPPVEWDAPPSATGAWQVPDAGAGSRLDIANVFARTIDTFLAHWPTFVALSLPSAALGVAYYWIASSVTSTPALSLLYLLFIPIAIWVTLAITIAADFARQGVRPAAASAAGAAVTPTFVAILSGFVVFLVVCLLAVLPTLLLVVARGGPAAVVGAIAFLIAFLIIFYVLIRWALAPTAIALEGAGPITALSRSWQATDGNIWRLGVVIVAVGLLGVPWSFAGSFFALAGNIPAAIAIGVVATLLVGSLAPIVTCLAYGDITDRPRALVAVPSVEPSAGAAMTPPLPVDPAVGDRPPVVAPPLDPGADPAGLPDPTSTPVASELSTTRGLRWTYALGVLIVGFILLVPAAALAVPKLGELALGNVPAEDRGVIYFGTQRNPVNPCSPLGKASTFSTTDPIYLGGYFSRAILPGQSASLHVYSGGQEVVNTPIEAGSRAVACYYEPDPLVGAPAGIYRIVIDDPSGTLAEGTFTVQ